MREELQVATKASQQLKQKRPVEALPSVSYYGWDPAVERMFRLQRIIGNRAVQKFFTTDVLHTKRRIARPNNVYKSEAGGLAETVTWRPMPVAGTPVVQRLCSACNEEIQRESKEDGESEVTQLVQSRRISPFPVVALPATEARIPARWARGHSPVGLARAVSGPALSAAKDIVFGAGQYVPKTTDGRSRSGVGSLVQRQDEDEAEGTVPAPGESFLFADMPESVTWHHPSNPRHPAHVRREGQTLHINFVGRLESKLDPVVLPDDPDLDVYRVAFTGTLYVTMRERGVDFGGKYATYTVDKFGNVLSQRYDNFFHPGQQAEESRRQLFSGLTVNVTAGSVTYGHKTGGLKVSFDRGTTNSVITDVLGGAVRFDGAKAGYPRTLDLRVSDAGAVVLTLAGSGGAVKLGFKLEDDVVPSPESSEFDVAEHDRVVTTIRNFNVDVQEEGRVIPADALAALKRILINMRPEIANALREQGAAIRFSLADHVSESRQENFFLRVGGMTVSRVESGAFAHEFTHMLFQLAGLRTDDLDPTSVSDKLREDMERAVGEGRAADPQEALRVLSTDSRLNRIWLDMFHPLDPKREVPGFTMPEEPMIIDLASEKNYGQRTLFAEAGHPEDNVNEFVASYVNLATLMRDRFIAAVNAAKAARGRRRDRPGVAPLFRDTWSIVSERMVDLGKNPF